MKNAANDSSTAEMVGRRVAITSVRGAVISTKTAFRLGKLALMVMALDTAVNAWNHLMFPDEEDALPETIAGQSHIMLGRRENGDPIYFSRLGLLQDMLEWFGLEDYRLTLNELATGKTTWQEVVKGMVLSPLDKIWQGSRPFYKLAGELAFRRSTFPSVFEPRGIRDRAYHFAKAFGLENEYVALRGLPSRGYQDTMIKFFAYSVNPQESAYGNLLDKKNKFMKKVLKLEGDGFFFSPKGNAMYNYRLAVKLGDKDAERRFFKEYMKYSAEQTAMKGKQFSLGQAFKLMQGSIKRAHPLYGLNDLQKIAFVAQLDERQKKDYAEAFEFWYEILGGNQLK